MSYKIIVDSCGELTDEMKKSGHYKTASLSMQVDGTEVVDDETFDQAGFLKLVAESPQCPKSSCPSPEEYMSLYSCGADRIYVVTLSSELSGSYNSAMLGRDLLLEEKPEQKIHVFNSRSASIGETLIALKIAECEKAGMKFHEIIQAVEAYISSQHTFFVLENLDTLRKNGRLSLVKAFVASALKIKPVMGSTDEGTICQLDQARGINKALVKLVDYVVERTVDSANRILAISHCNCRDRAEIVRDAILARMKVKDVILLDTAGVSTMYANDGGVIVVA